MSFDRDLRTNPYSPPGSDFNAGVAASSQMVELAERGTRLWAVTIDGMLICIPLLPLMAIAVYFAVVAEAAAARATTEAEAICTRLIEMFNSGAILNESALCALSDHHLV